MGGCFNGINRKFGTYDLTVVAIHTGLRDFHGRRVVAFLIKVGGKMEDFPGTELNAVPTPFTTILKDVNNTHGHLYIFRIKWNPPEIHTPFLQKPMIVRFFFREIEL